MVDLILAEKEINFVLETKEFNLPWQVLFYTDLMRIIKLDRKITLVTRDAYERYYGMRRARLSNIWLDKYFDIANKYLKEDNVPSSFEYLMKEVGPDGNSVQFSFVSKLFHTLKEDEPIYDICVREFLNIGFPSGNTPKDRMESAIEIYKKKVVTGFYKNDDYIGLRSLMLRKFDEKFSDIEGVSEIKKIDFVCWGLGKTVKKITVFED